MAELVGVPLYDDFWEELADELPAPEFKALELLEPSGSSELSEELSGPISEPSEDTSTEVLPFDELSLGETAEFDGSEPMLVSGLPDPVPPELQPQSAILSVIAARINDNVLCLLFINSSSS